jgi:hypothetical protein
MNLKEPKAKIKYHKSVPQEIIDLMGDKSYRYIWNYNSQLWRSVTIATPPTPPPTQITINVDEGDLEGTLEEAITTLKNYIDDPDYVSGRLYVDQDYDYEYDTSRVVCAITQKHTPSDKELEAYNREKAVYDAELEIYKKLKAIVTPILEAEELLVKDNKIKAVEKQMANLEKQLAKLKK